jgi:hypothetical protein
MDFYERYPEMFPYIGKHFHQAGTTSLLLVGESHYIAKDSAQRRNPESWYSGNSATLSSSDREWINTRAILEDSRANGFSNKAHSIWSNAFRLINEYGPRYSDYRCVANDVALYNFFLRPAVNGDSIKHELCRQDSEIANEAFVHHFDSLKPDAVIFLSMLAHQHCNHPISIPTVATPHPGCKHWNGIRAKYGMKRGKDLLIEFIKTLDWRRSESPAAKLASAQRG